MDLEGCNCQATLKVSRSNLQCFNKFVLDDLIIIALLFPSIVLLLGKIVELLPTRVLLFLKIVLFPEGIVEFKLKKRFYIIKIQVTK